MKSATANLAGPGSFGIAECKWESQNNSDGNVLSSDVGEMLGREVSKGAGSCQRGLEKATVA